MNKITEIDKEYVADTYARFPLELESGKGSLLYDTNGKEYIAYGGQLTTFLGLLLSFLTQTNTSLISRTYSFLLL